MWIWLSDHKRMARKAHRCYLCGDAIEANTPYVERIGLNDDQQHIRSRMHKHCEEITQQWSSDDWEYHDVAEFRQGLEVVYD